MVANKELDFWIQNNYNVLFIGEAGVGKTSLVLDAFKRNELNWQYYSASTMDPWVDLVGVPKEVKNENGESHLELIKPKQWQDNSVQAIFIDEYNRAGKKIRNAIMELIQFKSINGKRYDNLRIIWAAINPEESDMENEYDIEKLDPAQKDRFHFHVNIPYKPSLSYFNTKYGNDVGAPAVEWWQGLPKEIKREVSPRRLDYAIDIHNNGGKLDYALPKKSNITKLLTMLGQATYLSELKALEANGNKEAIETWLANDNNYFNVTAYVWETVERRALFVPLMHKEKVSAVLSTNLSDNKALMKELGSLKNESVDAIIAGLTKESEQKPKKVAGFIGQIDYNSNYTVFMPKGLESRGLITDLRLANIDLKCASRPLHIKLDGVRDLINLCPPTKTLSVGTALRIFKFFLNFAARSQHKTIVKSKMIGCFNHIVAYLISQGAFPPASMTPGDKRTLTKIAQVKGSLIK